MKRLYAHLTTAGWLAGTILALLMGSLAARSTPAPALAAWAPPDGNTVQEDVLQAIARQGEARVVIMLATAPDTPFTVADIAVQQDILLAQLPADAFILKRRFETLPALAGILDEDGLAALASQPNVARVQLDVETSGHLGQSVSALQADVVHATYGLTGAGQRIAVLDTGIDINHPDLAAAVVAQRCFTDGDCAPHGGDVGDNAEDEHGHGSNVSGIITADGLVSGPGFAPDAEVVAIRVLNEANWGWLSDWVAGLDWILANQASLQVDVVNMSLGTVALYEGNCDDEWLIVAQAVAQLAQIGVPVFASSGNQGAAAAMGSPACNQDVIAVGATYDGSLGRQPVSGTFKSWFGGRWPDCYDAASSLHTVTCFTNGGEMLDLLAPGMWITSAGMGGGLSTYAGTSQASPTAASVAALLLEASPELTPTQVESTMHLSGVSIVDPKNGRAVAAINALAAIEALEPVAPQILTITAPSLVVSGVVYPFTGIVTPTNATRPLSYLWQAAEHASASRNNGPRDTIVLSWPTAGQRRVQLAVSNEIGEIETYVDVDVIDGAVVWLPMVTRGR